MVINTVGLVCIWNFVICTSLLEKSKKLKPLIRNSLGTYNLCYLFA